MTEAAKEQNTVIESYSAVADVRRIRDGLAQAMKDMAPEEQVAYIQDQAATFRREQGLPEVARGR